MFIEISSVFRLSAIGFRVTEKPRSRRALVNTCAALRLRGLSRVAHEDSRRYMLCLGAVERDINVFTQSQRRRGQVSADSRFIVEDNSYSPSKCSALNVPRS